MPSNQVHRRRQRASVCRPVIILSFLCVLLVSESHVAAFVAPNRYVQTWSESRIRTSTAMFMEEKTGLQTAKVRFTATSLDKDSVSDNGDVVDTVLSWVTSDVGSIILGGVGLVLLLCIRLILNDDVGFSDTTSDPEQLLLSSTRMGEETRANLLAVFAIGAILLNGLSQLDVQSALAEQVQLQGPLIGEPIVLESALYSVNAQAVSWTLASVVAATPASTAMILIHTDTGWQPIAYTGVVHPNLVTRQALDTNTPIMNRFVNLPSNTEGRTVQRSESFLPTLQALPGKTEFTTQLLPVNTQAALLVPLVLSSDSVSKAYPAILLLGSNQARSFTPRDIVWSQTVVARLEANYSALKQR